jgi:S1-C subfamily serine protease
VQIVAGENQDGNPQSLGTGFFINNSGRLVTAGHVLTFPDAQQHVSFFQPQAIILHDKTKIQLRVANSMYPHIDKTLPSDLLVIETGHSSTCFLNIGSSANLKIGDHIISIGYPASTDAALYEGILSVRQKLPNVDVEYLRVQMPITAGASGSPLIADDNSVVGVIDAVPLPATKAMLDYLESYKHGGPGARVIVGGFDSAAILADFLKVVREFEAPGTAFVVPISYLGKLDDEQRQK